MWMDCPRLYRSGRRSAKLTAMTNVVQLRPGVWPSDQSLVTTAARDATPLVGLLIGMIERVEGVGAQAALLDRPPLQIERIVQALLDAATALEQATDALLDGDDDR
jgi:hypothetical protein